jgi:hypothetical protein
MSWIPRRRRCHAASRGLQLWILLCTHIIPLYGTRLSAAKCTISPARTLDRRTNSNWGHVWVPARTRRPAVTARAVVRHSAPTLAFAAAAEPHDQSLSMVPQHPQKCLPPHSLPRTFLQRSMINEMPLLWRQRINHSQQSHASAHLRLGPRRLPEHRPNLTRAVQRRPGLNHLILRPATRRYRPVIKRLLGTQATPASPPATRRRRSRATRRQRLVTRFSRVRCPCRSCRSNGPAPLAG